MILEIDAGNTFIKWRVLERDAILKSGRLLTSSICNCIPPEWSVNGFTGIRAASVAGAAINRAIQAGLSSRHEIDVRFAQTEAYCAGVKNGYAEPHRMGVDRWLAVLAAYNLTQQSCCVIDCGSAITVDFVDAVGCHKGGYILPGLRLMKQGLLLNTAEVEVGYTIPAFNVEPGGDTVSAVENGIHYLFMALAEKLGRNYRLQGAYERLFVTGGDGKLFASFIHEAEYIPDLVLDGLVWSLDR